MRTPTEKSVRGRNIRSWSSLSELQQHWCLFILYVGVSTACKCSYDVWQPFAFRTWRMLCERCCWHVGDEAFLMFLLVRSQDLPQNEASFTNITLDTLTAHQANFASRISSCQSKVYQCDAALCTLFSAFLNMTVPSTYD